MASVHGVEIIETIQSTVYYAWKRL